MLCTLLYVVYVAKIIYTLWVFSHSCAETLELWSRDFWPREVSFIVIEGLGGGLENVFEGKIGVTSENVSALHNNIIVSIYDRVSC